MKQIFILIVLIIGFVGCGDNEPAPVSIVDTRINEGWKEYIAGNYKDATAKFQEVLKEDPNNAEAYNGIGWAEAKMKQINSSIDNFKIAVSKNPKNADAYAGLAGAYFAVGNYEEAIASAKLVLSIDSGYVSYHDNVSAKGIRILLAESYYYIGDYSSAREQIDIAGYGKTLNPGSPTYRIDLLLAIEELAGRVK